MSFAVLVGWAVGVAVVGDEVVAAVADPVDVGHRRRSVLVDALVVVVFEALGAVAALADAFAVAGFEGDA